MTLADLLWFPPVMMGIAMVLGAASAEDDVPGDLMRSVLRTFLLLSVSVLIVGAVIFVIANTFSG